MLYETFPQFNGGLREAGFKGTDIQSDILFEYYNHARRQASVILGRLDDLKPLAARYGTAFEGRGGQLLLTPAGYNEEMGKKQGKKWSIWLNDSFILGGIHGRATFYLKSNPDSLDYVDPKNEFVFNVTQRELIGLTTFGYSRGAGNDPKGMAFNCTDTRLADSATFKLYVDQIERLAAAAK